MNAFGNWFWRSSRVIKHIVVIDKRVLYRLLRIMRLLEGTYYCSVWLHVCEIELLELISRYMRYQDVVDGGTKALLKGACKLNYPCDYCNIDRLEVLFFLSLFGLSLSN